MSGPVLLRSTAVVATDAPQRYAKQLVSHLGRKATVEPLDGDADTAQMGETSTHGATLVFAYGTAAIRPQDHQLVLEAVAADAESLAHVEDVVARHLEKFGARRELAVNWERSTTDG